MIKRSSGLICCLLAAFFWGTTFVAQDAAAATIPAFTFLALRSFVGAGALLLLFLIKDKWGKGEALCPPDKDRARLTVFGGALCGVFLLGASALQQLGIASNTGSPGKDAFITALYIVFVPLIGLIFGKRAPLHIYGCVAVALGGLWLLCMNGTALTTGDVQLMVCSLLFACQMVLVDRIGNRVDAVRLSAMQFLVVGVLSTVLAFIFETPTLSGVLAGWWTVLYAGIFSSAIAYTLQIVGQQRTPPTLASLVLSLESVVAVVASMIALRLYPTLTEIVGMLLIFVAIIVAQIPFKYKKRANIAE